MSERTDQQQRGQDGRVAALQARPEFRGPVAPLTDHEGGGHLALIYETREQQVTTVVPFIEQGLERGEQCLYIADATEHEAVLDMLRSAGIAVDAARTDGQLVVRSVAETYQRDGGFDPDAMLGFYEEAIEDAVTEHEALRVTAETAWIAAQETAVPDVIEYEARVTDLFREEAAMALCQYDRNRFPDAVIHDVIRTHPHIVYEQTVSQNVYYAPSLQEVATDRERDLPAERMLERLRGISETVLECDEHREALCDFAKICSRLDRSLAETVQDLLHLGCEWFDHEIGVMARVNSDTGRFEIEHTSGDHDYFTPGSTLPLSKTACQAAIDGGAVADLPLLENGRNGVTVIEEFGVQAALGTYIEIDRGADRLLFFIGDQPLTESIPGSERRFHAMLGRWIQVELEQQWQDEEMCQVTQLLQDVLQGLTAASTRTGIEQTVCDRFAAAARYEAAWIGTRPVTGQRLTPAAWTGVAEDTVQAVCTTRSEQDTGVFPNRVIETGEPAVIRAVDDESESDPFVEHLRDQGLGAAIAISLGYHDTCYGVLVVYAEQADAFPDRYRPVLAACGRWVGFAITATERKEALVTDEVVELEVEVRDPDHFFFSVTDEVDVAFTLEGIIAQSTDSYLVYVAMTGDPVEAVLDHAEQDLDIDHARLVTDRGDEALLECVFAGPTVAETFAECGGTVTAATAADGEGTVTVELPQTADVRTVVETVQTTFPEVEVVAKRTRDRSGTIVQGFRHEVSERLTEKQRDVLRAAFLAGYFQRPRQTTGDELAETLDIAPSTFHQHLQVGLHKLLTAAFDDQTTR